MAPTNLSKNKIKASKNRPTSTATISQPVVEDASTLTSLSAFSQDGHLFAYLHLAVDKHRLTVYNTTSNHLLADYTVDSARVSALVWGTLNFSAESQPDTPSPSKKKRKKRQSLAAEETQSPTGTQVVILGLTDGTISFFSPSHGRVLRTLSHPSSSTPILALATSEHIQSPVLWSSSADGTVRAWNVQTSAAVDTWKTDDRIPYTSLTIRPNNEDGRTDLLVAHHNLRLVSRASEGVSAKTIQLASFTGHASSIKSSKWADSRPQPNRFVTMAEGDRFLYIWDVEDGTSSQGKASASVPLDSDSRTFAISTASGKATLASLSASGRVSIYPIPEELSPPASNNNTTHKIPTLLPRSNIVAPSKNSASVSPVVNIAFIPTDAASLRVVRLAKGVRPVFTTVNFLDDSGSYATDITLEELDLSVVKEDEPGVTTQRYVEGSAAVVGSGLDLGIKETGEDVPMRDVDGDLEVDLAELSLGQRLTALNDGEVRKDSDSENDDPQSKSSKKRKGPKRDVSSIPANSLTRTLIQALHSSDSRLLEACLSHSDATLIQNTVKRLPPQLAVPLVIACTERLGRGGRAANMKGSGGGASAQRGTGLITWIKIALAVHAGHLMTIPDLVARLSGLYTTINARLALHENLLALNGKLDMVLSQVEMRSSAAPAPLTVKEKKGKGKAVPTSVAKHYVEGESDSSDAEDDGDVDVESGDDEGSIEDVELGGESDEEGSEDDADDMDSEEDSEDGGSLNGFIDDEAEEWSDEDEDEDEFSE
ncbi:NUC189-domain-containing protein [Coprinopsis marcescibilis]|uniref:NUC189-domain-containing protein n=1 Tax=Coprinopsis marcescibilis TaxID=230819 RepID=A0A5C3LDH3_COPMA|nr:NUC189-domain-containing protein [Coprinopsis marcescibilis]